MEAGGDGLCTATYLLKHDDFFYDVWKCKHISDETHKLFKLRISILCRVKRHRDIFICVAMEWDQSQWQGLRVFLHLAHDNLGDIQLKSDGYCSISIAVKVSLWFTAYTKLSRSKIITNKKKKNIDNQSGAVPEMPKHFLSSLFTKPIVVQRSSRAWGLTYNFPLS